MDIASHTQYTSRSETLFYTLLMAICKQKSLCHALKDFTINIDAEITAFHSHEVAEVLSNDILPLKIQYARVFLSIFLAFHPYN